MTATFYLRRVVPSPLVRHRRFAVALPLRRNRDAACSPPYRTTRPFGADTVWLIDLTERFGRDVASASSSAGAQIPIAS
jgi:hypothetical protein